MVEISNHSAELFVKRHGPLPVCNAAGWVEKLDASSLGESRLLDRAEVFYVLGKWRTREEFNELLREQQAPDNFPAVALSAGPSHLAPGGTGSFRPRSHRTVANQAV